LTSLVKAKTESVTDYMLRAEKAASSLKFGGEIVSDSLLIAMIMKGLPHEFKPFVVVHTQTEKVMTFQEFKVLLRSYEETEQVKTPEASDNVFKYANRKQSNAIVCYSCGKQGHKKSDCFLNKNSSKKKFGLWCSYCKQTNHSDRMCRKQNKSHDSVRNLEDKPGSDDNSENCHSFMFKADGVFSQNKYEISENSVKLLIDCGATSHVINDDRYFINYDSSFRYSDHEIELADGSRVKGVAKKRGDAVVNIFDNGGILRRVVLQNSLYVPSYPQNIFSVRAAAENGVTVVLSKDDSKLLAPDGTTFKIVQHGRMFYFDNVIFTFNNVDNINVARDLNSWHRILGHCNIIDITHLESLADGIKIVDKDNFHCETCIIAKQPLLKSTKPRDKAKNIFDLVHTDLAGPIAQEAREGFKYAITFTDDCSGAIFVYFLKNKSDAPRALEKFLADSSIFGTVKIIRSDNGSEFTCKEFQDILIKNKIGHQTSAPYSAHQNGTAERGWRTLFEMARCMLTESGLPKYLWTYAVLAAVYIRNRCFSSKINETPFYVLTGKKPNLGNMHIFGSDCYAYNTNYKGKLDPRCKKGKFVGYDKGSRAFLIYFSENNVVKRCRFVNFADIYVTKNVKNVFDNDEIFVPNCDAENSTVQQVQGENFQGNIGNVNGENNSPMPERRYPTRERKMPLKYQDYVVETDNVNCNLDYCYKVINNVPQSYADAISSSEATNWWEAMNDEMQSLEEQTVFTVTELPSDRETIGGKWVYALKSNPDGSTKYKARYVARGFTQVSGVDYDETFSPTAKMTSVRIIMQLAAQYDLDVHQLDVKTAYLNAPIDRELYVEQPKGFEAKSKGDKLVWRLNKSLYGLKQSGRNWNNMLHDYILSKGFKQSIADPCVYIMNFENNYALLLLWVDDIIVAANSEGLMSEIKCLLGQKLKVVDLGQIKCFLGMQFEINKDCIKIHQAKYLDKVLKHFDMENCKPRFSPSEAKLDFLSEEGESDIVNESLYREMIGSLVYAMICTRPDLCFIITRLSQYLDKPNQQHHVCVKHVLRYIKGSIDKGLTFRKSETNLSLVGYADADWGSSDDRRSTTGYVFRLNAHSSPISWKSKKQQCTALSSCEAEYIALSSATQEAIFLLRALNNFDNKCKYDSCILYGDNQGAIALAKNPIKHQRTKHIDIRYHFIREHITKGEIVLDYVPTDQNIADVFTKSVGIVKFKMFIPKLFGII